MDHGTHPLTGSALSVDDATWTRGRGWALWKTLVTYANTLDDVEAATASSRRILDEIFSEYTDGDESVGRRPVGCRGENGVEVAVERFIVVSAAGIEGAELASCRRPDEG